MRRALAKYRQEFRTLAAAWLATRGKGGSRATADGVAAAAVSFVHGCAIRAVVDPAGFDLKATLSRRPCRSAGRPRGSRRSRQSLARDRRPALVRRRDPGRVSSLQEDVVDAARSASTRAFQQPRSRIIYVTSLHRPVRAYFSSPGYREAMGLDGWRFRCSVSPGCEPNRGEWRLAGTLIEGAGPQVGHGDARP